MEEMIQINEAKLKKEQELNDLLGSKVSGLKTENASLEKELGETKELLDKLIHELAQIKSRENEVGSELEELKDKLRVKDLEIKDATEKIAEMEEKLIILKETSEEAKKEKEYDRENYEKEKGELIEEVEVLKKMIHSKEIEKLSDLNDQIVGQVAKSLGRHFPLLEKLTLKSLLESLAVFFAQSQNEPNSQETKAFSPKPRVKVSPSSIDLDSTHIPTTETPVKNQKIGFKPQSSSSPTRRALSARIFPSSLSATPSKWDQKDSENQKTEEKAIFPLLKGAANVSESNSEFPLGLDSHLVTELGERLLSKRDFHKTAKTHREQLTQLGNWLQNAGSSFTNANISILVKEKPNASSEESGLVFTKYSYPVCSVSF